LYYHPTQKALELAQRAIRNSSKVGDIVFDPFLGSGTTLIAAARLGRRCFGLEIEPKYCDCIVRRFIALAGTDAVSKELYERYNIEEVE
jgi:DNA modification methylase